MSQNEPAQNKSLSIRSGLAWFKGFLKEEVGLVYTTIGGVGASFIGALFWFVIASLLTVENYGLVNYYIAVASVFAAIGIIGMDATKTTYLAKGEKTINYEANSLTLISALTIAVALSAFQWTSGILAASMIFFTMTMAELLGGKNYQEYAVLSIGQRIAQITLSLLLYFQMGIIGILLGYFLGSLLFSYRYLGSIMKFTLKFDGIKEKRNFALHSYGFGLVRNFTVYLDKIVIAALFGYYALGAYQLGFQFFMLLSIIPASLFNYLLPEESSGKDKTKIKIVGFALSVAAFIAAFAAIPYLITTLFPNFTDSTFIVRIMSIAIIPSTVVAMLNASLLGKGKSKTVFIAGVVYIISLLTGLTILGHAMGSLGLALTLIIAQTIQATYLIKNRKTPQNQDRMLKKSLSLNQNLNESMKSQ